MKFLRCFYQLLFYCMLWPGWSYSQDYNYAHYTTRDGLASEILYTQLQDSEGFMWFATETGLSRFDGQKFRTFTTADGLPSNEIIGFYEDRKKRLWIKSFNEQPCYYHRGMIHNIRNTPELGLLTLSARLRSITETKQGDMIFMDDAGQMAVITRSGGIRRYIKGSFKIALKDVLYGSELNTDVLKLPSLVLATIDSCERSGMIDRLSYKSVAIANNAVMIQIGNSPKKEMETWLWYDGHEPPKVFTRPARLYAAFLNQESLLESYAKGGAGIYNLRTNSQTAFFLPSRMVNSIYRDRGANIWLSTKWDGLYKLSNKAIFSLQFNSSGTSPAVQFVHATNDKVFAGTDDAGFWKIATGYPRRDAKIGSFRKQKMNGSISWLKEHVADRCINYNGSDFLHLANLGINRHVDIKSLFLTGDSLLVATLNSVYLTSLADLSKVKKIHNGRATCAAQYNGYYYVGTLHGLYIYDDHFHLTARLTDSRISHFARGKGDIVWVSTYDNGAYALKGNNVIAVLNVQHGLLNSNLCRCIYYQDDDLWIGTDKGINRIRVNAASCELTSIYNLHNGLNADIINSIFVDREMVYAGTSAGLNLFSSRIIDRDTDFHLCFTQILSADTPTALDWPLVLPHTNNSIRFNYSGISYSAADITFRYRLLGLNDQWQKTNEQSLSFISLPSGRYRLQIQAFNTAGGKSLVIEKTFTVRQSRLEYWWVRLLLGVAAAVISVVIVYIAIKQIRKKEAFKRAVSWKMLELEQMALRAQMTPHFIFNCLNSVQYYILKHDVAGANRYLAQFAGLVRQTLENAAKPLISLQEEIIYLRHYIDLECLQVNFPFDYDLKVDPDIATARVYLPNMIIQPFIENAIKHGLSKRETGGHLHIQIEERDEYLICSIADNGPGINRVKAAYRSSTHRSKGLSLVEERINTLNLMRPEIPAITFHIEDLSDRGTCGTQVFIHIPVVLSPVIYH